MHEAHGEKTGQGALCLFGELEGLRPSDFLINQYCPRFSRRPSRARDAHTFQVLFPHLLPVIEGEEGRVEGLGRRLVLRVVVWREVRVLERLLDVDTALRAEGEQLLEEVDRERVRVREEVPEALLFAEGERADVLA